jgi:hypothetical protein
MSGRFDVFLPGYQRIGTEAYYAPDVRLVIRFQRLRNQVASALTRRLVRNIKTPRRGFVHEAERRWLWPASDRYGGLVRFGVYPRRRIIPSNSRALEVDLGAL